ncbi:ankyrin repeat-containing protein BDA1-like [Arachis stenosperma]|uniref:ankyrin repeat-containing protein BDA1-like n=1 Tax=Arachis stenosperma TaxID=217475 RepID=UPI0025ABAEFB|nr:ankyrin repeat-containing protein BDA1-like [Arachis stenosperma]
MANVGTLGQASTSRNINTLYQAIQQDSSILKEIDAMLEQAAISGNKLHPAIKHNSSILEEINAMLEQAATFRKINMLYLAIQQNPNILEKINAMLLEQDTTSRSMNMLYRAIEQNPSILEEVNTMLEQVATSRDINLLYQATQQNPGILHVVNAMWKQATTSENTKMFYQAIQQNPNILEVVNAMREQIVTSGNISMLSRAIQQDRSIQEEVNVMLKQTVTSTNMNMLYRTIQQNPSILEEVNAMLEQAATCKDINMFYRTIQHSPNVLQVVNAMLVRAATFGNIDMLYRAIQQNPTILEEVDAIPFVNTPLHTAASAGHIEFAIEIMGLKPSFGFKLNSKGMSPIHVALLRNRHDLVYRLVEINKDLVRVKGKERLTPLHLLCQSGSDRRNIRLLIHFLDICPDSIKDVNVRKETALHIALRCGNLSALEKMVDWLKENTFYNGADDLERSILNRTVDGNNILHLATLCGNTQGVMLLIGSKKMDKNAKNSSNQTALDLAIAHSYPEIERILEGAKAKRGAATNHGGHPKLRKAVLVFRRKIWPIRRIRNSMSSQQREAYMVVAALIITTVYQTALNPPGGLYQPDNNLNSTTSSSFSLNSTNTATVPRIAGKASIKPSEFILISMINTATLYFAITTIIIVMPDGIIGVFLGAPVMFLALSYVGSIGLIAPTGKGFIISFPFSCGVLVFFLFMWIPGPEGNRGLVA